MKIPDLLKENLKVVFCGTAAGNRSAQQEAYYAGCGNKFYCVLHHAGFTPVQLIPSQYEQLIDYGIGLTDLVKQKSGMDKDLKQEDYNISDFNEKIEKYKPQFVCFNGKEAAKKYFGVEKIDYGLQNECLGETKFFVAPSTSAKAHSYWNEEYWKKLNTLTNGKTHRT
ncbi:MAG: mismatch-specific DNA-glycosylase [Bacteroidales bacterium]|jgi:TDG/mug DNA glycosylase family protein|nr:mismatch-specific DNA-glycosylase [Bacteroidales bacterium]